MKKCILIVLLSVAGSVAFSSILIAAPPDQVVPGAEEAEQEAEQEAELEAKLEDEYKQALAVADKSRADAAVSLEKAREQLHLATQQRQREAARSGELGEKRHAEMAAMREELNRAHRELRNASREISRVSRDLVRARMASEAPNYVFRTGDRPVLGVILGDSNDVGIQVLGVSPDGPAERAGVEAGDVIVALGGRVLAAVDESGDVRAGINDALGDIKAEEPVIVSVERGSETLDLTVIPEVREPLTWQSVIRFPSAPAPDLADNTIIIEKIVVPEIDTEALTEQIENMRIKIGKRRMLIESGEAAPMASHYELQFDDMSEMGDFALHDTNAWFGTPLASGLRLAAIDPGLGEYFRTDRGVLVIDIKRKRKSKTLKPIIEESQARFFTPKSDHRHRITVTADSE